MPARPSLEEIEAAARVLDRAGRSYRWWNPELTAYEELAAKDPIGKSEFDGIVEQMLMAAEAVRAADSKK